MKPYYHTVAGWGHAQYPESSGVEGIGLGCMAQGIGFQVSGLRLQKFSHCHNWGI